MVVLQKENGKLLGFCMWFKKPFAYTILGLFSFPKQKIEKMNFRAMHYGFASVHTGQNLLCSFSHPPAFTRLPIRTNYEGLTHGSIMAQVCATVAAIGMNQSVWLHQPCPFPPASYPALFSSFLDATCLPSFLLRETPATFSSLPMVFSACLLFANPFSLVVLPTTLCRYSVFCCFIWAAVVCHYFCKAI